MRVCHIGRQGALALLWIGCLPAVAAAAQAAPRVTVEPVECFPLGRHAIVEATVENDLPGHTPRLYFRRMNQEVEDFYWVDLEPRDGGYWAALPQPEDHELPRHALASNADAEQAQLRSSHRWAAWWKAKELSEHRDPNRDLDRELIDERAQVGSRETRDWMIRRDDAAFESWLDDLGNEPVEYYAAVVDTSGEVVPGSRTPMQVAPVGAPEDCADALPRDERQEGAAVNLTIGETAPWQEGEKLFHWNCHGVVTRVDSTGVPRADEICRACIVGFRPERALPALAGITAITIAEPPNPSPTFPGPR